jgi:hypothetical protein
MHVVDVEMLGEKVILWEIMPHGIDLLVKKVGFALTDLVWEMKLLLGLLINQQVVLKTFSLQLLVEITLVVLGLLHHMVHVVTVLVHQMIVVTIPFVKIV